MGLTPYERKILEVFASSYRSSAQYRDGRKLRKGNWERRLPEIGHDSASKENFLDAAEALVEQGVVSVKWKRFREGDDLDALYLEDAEKLYALLGEKYPDDERREMIALLDTASGRGREPWEARVWEYCMCLLAEKRFPQELRAADFTDILRLLALSPAESAGCSIRALSVRMFNRSKRIEELIDSCDSLAMRATGEKLSERLGISRTYPETTIAGNIILRFEDGPSWDLAGKAIVLPYRTVRGVREIGWHGPGRHVLSIENKETFAIATERLRHRFDAFVYTSGQVNTADRALVDLLLKSGAALFHFGDLDPGGLAIYSTLREAAGGKIAPYKMDLATYERYLPHGYKLTAEALRLLDRAIAPELCGLRDVMKRTGVGVEQEIIDLSDEPDEYVPGSGTPAS